MAQLMKNRPSQWWRLESHSTTKRSAWLQSTLNELNEKTKAMLKLIEEDADSFAKRAEMYYKKRPELISMVEDFYRTHRSLAERYDQVKPDTGFRQLKIGGSPFASPKKLSFGDNGYDTYSENCDIEESVESEVDDPEKEEEERGANFDNCTKEKEVGFVNANNEVMRLRKEIEGLHEENKAHNDEIKQKDTICGEVMVLMEEVEKLRKENRAQKDQLKQKDEEKIKVIRHMSLAIDVLKQENVKMRSFIAKESKKKWKNPFEFNKLMGALSGKLFNGGTTRNQTSVVAL